MSFDWKLATIPVVAAVIGYATNWLAVKMTFKPVDFVGIEPYLGWQGIIPSKARKMASIAVDASLAKLATLSEIFEEMDPDRIAEHLLKTIEPRIDQLTEAIIREREPGLWDDLPRPVKIALIERVRRRLPSTIDALVDDMVDHIEHLLDLRLMVVRKMAEDRTLLNRTFWEVGREEFRFIIRSGAYFGGLLGLIQMLIWMAFPAWWILPLAGLGVGYATNWLALNIIFRPVVPRKVGPFVLHGLFLRRQEEVSEEYAHLITREVLTLRNFSDEMLNGPRGDRTRALIRRHAAPIVDEALGIVRPAVELAVGSRDMAAIREDLSVQAIELSAEAFDDPVFNAERSVVVEREMAARMKEMSPSEFRGLLRPAFEEEEWKLIAVGSVLGGLAGLAQSVFVFG
ncbi:MAG: hypothetical protein R3320_13410 [Nitriliruptorales bacterium]|nr:hypothetical protein [Nitriliruptorales bacterium]